MKCQNLSDIELEKNSVNHKLASVTHEKEFIQVIYGPFTVHKNGQPLTDITSTVLRLSLLCFEVAVLLC